MAKRKYDLSVVILTLLVTLMPVLGAAWDKVAVIYTSLFVLLAAFGYRVWKTGSIKVTKTAMVFSGIALFSYLQLFWVSDKGAQVSFASVFLAAALAAFVIADIKSQTKEDAFTEGMISVGYIAALIYGVWTFLYQVFIESNFLLGGMDLGGGTSTATAIIMLFGIVFALKLFEGREKTAVFYPSLIFMGIVFVLTGSLMGYLILAVMLLYFVMEIRHKRMEALGVLVVIVVLAATNVMYAVWEIFTSAVESQGAFRGLVSILGIGKGGYDAAVAVFSSGYTSSPTVFFEFMEVWGIIGIGIIVLLAYGVYVAFGKKHDATGVLLGCSAVAIVLARADALLYMLVILAVLYAAGEDSAEVKITPLWSVVCVIPMLFFALLAFSRIPFMIAGEAEDYGKYEKAADYYAISARCGLFDSKVWEKAYLCADKAYEEGIDTVAKQNEYITNALKFNKKNYLYRVYLAQVYTRSGNVKEALDVWNGIILRYDRESLYVPYTRAVCNMMEKGNVDLTTMEELYSTILEYAHKATDKTVKYEVNNVLTESQQYYIEKREGADVFYQEAYEEVTEPATEEEMLPSEGVTEEL